MQYFTLHLLTLWSSSSCPIPHLAHGCVQSWLNVGSSAPQGSSSKLLSCHSIRNNFCHVSVPFKAALSQLAELLLIGSTYHF